MDGMDGWMDGWMDNREESGEAEFGAISVDAMVSGSGGSLSTWSGE